jgi:hypothetical protein
MKKIIGIFILLSIIGCDFPSSDSKTSICEKFVQFGNTNICLPIVDGMTECYTNPIIRLRADKYNYDGNTILAYYLNNTTYKNVENIEDKDYDDFFLIQGVNALKEIKMGEDELIKMDEMVNGKYIRENWKDLKLKFEKGYENISIGRPILIESYKTNKNERTNVLLSKYQKNGIEKVLILIMNFIIIKERVVTLSYYKNYNGESSIIEAKAKNDYITLQVIDENL